MKAALPLLAAALTATACVPAAVPPAATPAPAPRPAPAPPAASPALPVTQATNWIDNPQTPGDWRYRNEGGRSEASFWTPGGAPLARLRCVSDNRTVVLSLPESGTPRPIVTIRAETQSRTLEAQSGDREMTVALDPRDPLLDAVALSQGRFALESEGLAPLYLPAWAEVSRVIEDCR